MRRGLLGGGAALVALLAWQAMPAGTPGMGRMSLPVTAGQRAAWASWRDRFLHDDGRVVDVDNGGVSHSEGQGYGLLFAEAAADRAAFDRILAWTGANLGRADDRLLAWRFRPGAATPVDDQNNATDGDIWMAWALLRAGTRWGGDYNARAQALCRDILRLAVIEVGRRTLLLPGVEGFRHREEVVVNPSYYVFPALQAFAAFEPAWRRVIAGGLDLLREARFGRHQLPPDWLAVPRADLQPRLALGKPARFGLDAGRIPLHLVWGGLSREPAVAATAAFWAGADIPDGVGLADDVLSPRPASPGQQAVALLAIQASRHQTPDAAALPDVAGAGGYFSSSLAMLARLAASEAGAGMGADTLPTHR